MDNFVLWKDKPSYCQEPFKENQPKKFRESIRTDQRKKATKIAMNKVEF